MVVIGTTRHVTCQGICLPVRRIKTKAEAVVAKLRQKNIAGIRRGDLLDFRSSLQTKGVSGNNINSIMKAIKVVFSELYFCK